MRTSAFGRLGGGQGNAAQAEQFEEGGGVLVELTQLSLRPRQVDTAETHEEEKSQRFSEGAERSSTGHEGR